MRISDASTARVSTFVLPVWISIGAITSPVATAQPTWHNLDAGEYAVGFRLLQEHDPTRPVAELSHTARPVRVYVWYPATPSTGASPMRFGRYVAMAEDDVWPGPERDRLRFSRGPLARSLGVDGLEALGEQPVRAFENAEPLPGPFPLIVIGQGLNYESPLAFAALSEYLAGRGFVVATCPLVGTHTRIVKLDAEDLEHQVRDLELVVARVRAFPHVSPDDLGVMGFDMGGMVGLILAMRNATVDAFASVEAGILFPHPSGLPSASPDYDPLKLRIPWLHAGRGGAEPTDGDTPSLFETAVHSERYRLHVDGMRHVDATSYALVEGRDAILGFWGGWEASGVQRLETISRYVSEFFTAFLKKSSESLASLSRDAPPSYSLEHRSATPPPITYAQFVNAVLTGDVASAIDEVRDMRNTDPSHILLNDAYLYRLAYSLLYTWGLRDESLQLALLNVELNPSSTLAARGLSMSYVDRGDYARAIEVYRRFLERNPDHESARRTMEWLQGQLQRLRNEN